MVPDSLRTLWFTERARLIVVFGICAMVTINQSGTGVLSAVIPVKLAADGHPASTAGAISTVFSVCFLVGCLVGPQFVRRIGPTRAIWAVAGLNAVLALLFWAVPSPFAWTLFRGMGGMAAAVYFVLIESWLSAVAPSAVRGLIFGFYMILNRLAFALGQFVIAFVEPAAITQLFLVSIVAYMISPLFKPGGKIDVPVMSTPKLANYLELPKLAPAAAAAAAVHGLAFGSVPNLIPKWGIDVGISVALIGEALSVMQVGGIFVQLPLSLASDRFDRRLVMAFACFMTSFASLALMQLSPTSRPAWLILMFLWGGFASVFYSLASAHAGDLAPPERRVAWVSSLMLIWGERRGARSAHRLAPDGLAWFVAAVDLCGIRIHHDGRVSDLAQDRQARINSRSTRNPFSGSSGKIEWPQRSKTS